MSDHSEESAPEPKAPKKSRLGLVLAIVAVVVLVTGAAVAGTVFGPTLLGKKQADGEDASAQAEGGKEGKKKPKGKGKAEAADADEPVGDSVELAPILVDSRSKDGEIHHIKVVLAIELSEGTKKEEFMKLSPRGREVAVAFLRSQGFDELAAPEHYDELRAELGKKFTEAVGEQRIGRVMVIDFVAQ